MKQDAVDWVAYAAIIIPLKQLADKQSSLICTRV